jgi:hypothetical protein
LNADADQASRAEGQVRHRDGERTGGRSGLDALDWWVHEGNAGRKTAGVDGQVALSSAARAEMAVRVHQTISTWDPLGCLQGVHLLAPCVHFALIGFQVLVVFLARQRNQRFQGARRSRPREVPAPIAGRCRGRARCPAPDIVMNDLVDQPRQAGPQRQQL